MAILKENKVVKLTVHVDKPSLIHKKDDQKFLDAPISTSLAGAAEAMDQNGKSPITGGGARIPNPPARFW